MTEFEARHNRREESTQVSGLPRLAVNRPLTLFFALAYLISWLAFMPIILWRAPIQLIAVASFGPTLAALITHRLNAGDYRAFAFHWMRRRTLMSAVIGAVLIVVAYVIVPGLVLGDPGSLHWGILISPGVYNYSTLLGGPLGEEPGWRGYALPRLEARFGAIRASLLLGILWTGWHLPLFLIKGWVSLPLWAYWLVLVGVSVIMSWGVNLARFSVLPAIVMHAAFNTVTRFLSGLFVGTAPRPSLPFEVVFPAGGLLVAVVLIVATRGRLSYRRNGYTEVMMSAAQQAAAPGGRMPS
jgi:membrane protease YdiL (CAAX protease family)